MLSKAPPSERHLLFIISAIRNRWVRENRYHMIPIVHLRLNTLTRLDVSRLHGGYVDMQPHLFAGLPLDETVSAFNTQHFALDRLVTSYLVVPSLSLSFICFSPAS